jgi:hypothetical protein
MQSLRFHARIELRFSEYLTNKIKRFLENEIWCLTGMKKFSGDHT